MDHIRELRTRLFICAAVLIVGGIIGYLFYTPILEWLRTPLGTNLYYSTPAGSFNFILKVSSMIGILAAVPFIIFQLIMFIQPVFKEKLSMTRIAVYTTSSILLAVVGALFAFYAILPGALKFFAGFQVAGLSALIDANNYLNFVINSIVTFIIVFQIPLLMIIIDRVKPISPQKLFAAEKYVIVGGLVVSLIVPFAMDLTTSLLIAGPIVILYNISVGMIMVRHFMARDRQATLPAIVPLTAEELATDEQLVTDFFADQPQSGLEIVEIAAVVDEVTTPIQTVMSKNVGIPLHVKPLPGQVNIAQLHADAKERRKQQIAQRVAQYNNASLKIINDIR